MASGGVCKSEPVDLSVDSSKMATTDADTEGESVAQDTTNVLPGALLNEAHLFKNRKGSSLTLTPIVVDFKRLLQSKSKISVVAGIPNRELLHSVVALYDVSLSEMTPDVLYSAVCDKNARTLLLIRDVKEVVTEVEQKFSGEKTEDSVTEDSMQELEKDIDECEDKFDPEEGPPPTFFEVFSDTDKAESEESDEEEEDFSKGMHTFIDKVKTRRQVKRKHKLHNVKKITKVIGAESRIVAAATYEKAYIKSGTERVVHLTLIATRKRFRRMGIGKYLLSHIKDNSVVGSYDAVVVHADNSALEFFDRYGFSDDMVLNSKYSELAEQFTNCTLMCYLPPFTAQTMLINSVPELDILAMEKEIKKWRDKSHEAYRAEVSCVNRLRQEQIHLRALVASQQEFIANLAAENESLRREKYCIEKEYLEYKLLTTKGAFHSDQSEDDDDAEVNELIKKLEAEADRQLAGHNQSKMDKDSKRKFYVSGGDGQDEPYDHGKDTEDFFKVSKLFCEAMKLDHNMATSYEVKMVQKAILSSSREEAYSIRTAELADPEMCTRLYFCGSLEKPNRIPDILKDGFAREDFSHADFGTGLYFSKFPSKAAQFSALGRILLVEVRLGKTETVVHKDRLRKQPSNGYDSIITPGRLIPQGEAESLSCQEYVIFDANQVKPLYLIEYTPLNFK